MGNRKNKLTWAWPLISIEWVPEILASIKNLIEPSWEGMRRQMTMNVPNRAFGNRLFSQVQALLIETDLVSDNGRYIKPTNGDSYPLIQEHLIEFFNNSSQNWAEYYRVIVNKETELYYDQIKKDPPQEWSKISDYVVFKQWAEFFHFLGLGTLLKNNHFVPESIINNNSKKTLRFVETSIKSYGDPRKLTGDLSLHTEADFLTWTRGEDYLPLSDDPELFPRIPYQMIIDEWEKRKYQYGSWRIALAKGKMEWNASIKRILTGYPFSDLNSFVYSCKHLLDYFLFGKPRLDSDHLDTEELSLTKKKWSMIENFKLSEQIWTLLPNLYKDITKLYWGIAFYRNSLQRPLLSENLYDQTIFDTIGSSELRKIPIRCNRSRRTIQAIIKSISVLYILLSKLNDNNVGAKIELKTKQKLAECAGYLPSDQLKRSDVFDVLEEFIELLPEKKTHFLNLKKFDIISNFPDDLICRLCFWVHKFYCIEMDPSLAVVLSTKKKLLSKQSRLEKKIAFFQIGMKNWDIICKQLRDTLVSRRPI
jgi:hypothetical protein